jgi:hypothetical protein
MATLVTTGGSQALRRLSLVRPVLIAFMADLRTIKPSSLLWDRVNHGKTGAKEVQRRSIHVVTFHSRSFSDRDMLTCRADAESQALGIEYSA